MTEIDDVDAAVQHVAAPLSPDDSEAVHRLTQAAEHVDHVAPISEQPLLWLTDPEAKVTHLLVRAADDLAGYAQVDLGAPKAISAEIVVHPLARQRGVGSALLHAVQDLGAQQGQAELSVWAHGDLEPARRLAKANNLDVVRELWSMGVDLKAHPPEEPELPAGVSVRPFVVGQDEERWLKQNARAFADHPEQGRLKLADLQARERADWFDPNGFLLLEQGEKLLGSAWTKVVDGVGEIYVVGIVPSAQGQGLGHVLTRLALRHLAQEGLTDVVLYVDADNTSAIRAYEAAGFERRTVSVKYGPQ